MTIALVRAIAVALSVLAAISGPIASQAAAPSTPSMDLINEPPRGPDGMTTLERIEKKPNALGMSATGYSQLFSKSETSSFSYFPDTAGYTFDVYSATASAGIEVGCDGVSIDALADSLAGQFEYIIEYYEKNALGLAITYLIYSRPTLAALIDKLKAAFQINLDHALLTCGEAKEMALKRAAENPDNKAWADCRTKNPGNEGACLGSASQFGASLDRVFNSAGGTIRSVTRKFRIPDEVYSVFGNSEGTAIASCSGLSAQEMTMAIDLVSYRDPANQNAVVPAKMTVDDLIRVRTGYLRGKYDYMVRHYDKSDWQLSSEFRETLEFSREAPITPKMFAKLKGLEQTNKGQYVSVLNELALRNAITTVESLVYRIEEGFTRCAATLSTDNPPYPYEPEYALRSMPALHAAIKRIKAQQSFRKETEDLFR